MAFLSSFIEKIKSGAEVFTNPQAREEAKSGIVETINPGKQVLSNVISGAKDAYQKIDKTIFEQPIFNRAKQGIKPMPMQAVVSNPILKNVVEKSRSSIDSPSQKQVDTTVKIEPYTTPTPGINNRKPISEIETFSIPGLDKLDSEPIKYNIRPVVNEYLDAIQKAYIEFPELHKGYLEAVFSKEADWGNANEKKKNNFVGKLGWIGGFRNPARVDYIRVKGKEPDLNTISGLVDAVAAYSDIRRRAMKTKTAVDLYNIYRGPSEFDIQIFEKMYNRYAQTYNQ